jgi:putative nucleotidyltransferase with HDIG domain
VSAGDLADDVNRRDFTVNSLLKDLTTGEILDLTGQGREDIKKGVIKTPLNPDIIFTEDPLRMLRAVRFAMKYDWDLPMFMLRALHKNAEKLVNISQERIRDELNKMLLTGAPERAIKLLKVTGLLKFVIPELLPAVKMSQNVHHKHDVFGHTLDVLKKTNPVLLQRLMALFHDIGKTVTRSVTPTGVHFYGHEDAGAEMASSILHRLKYPNEVIDAVVLGVKNHMKLKHGGDDAVKLSDKSLRKFQVMIGDKLDDVLDVIHADNVAHSDSSSMPNQINNVRERLKTLNVNTPSTPKLPINGGDLIQMGIKPGPIFAKILSAVTDKWYENPSISKEEAVNIAKDIIEQQGVK